MKNIFNNNSNNTQPFLLEETIVNFLGHHIPFLNNYMYDKISTRITLLLLFLGILAIINELFITIDMFFLSRSTYKELKKVTNLEDLLNHELLNDPKYFAKEVENGNEEFETMEHFFKKPVHVSHVSVYCALINGKDRFQPIIDRPLKFTFEFTPEDFENTKYSQDYGCDLYHLKLKIYHFFKDSEIYKELEAKNEFDLDNFTVSKSIYLYNPMDELMDSEKLNKLPLCFLKIETGDRLKCELVLR
ncbi:hypothetical protein HANVADRAFT_52826 [Hanseniaspora valbyensis NRRL Y-1626]|uniref:Uncharacterized protein n=1 Tax=Hanseniaspora valbyensis NRRL Y-1626 TaxID=766949 RepID=A0A1B7TDJ5_9ASCO|nr:hypothetical protein HANVADRAFT_52826 [Hanseniaspora valbyensis NRRL Y-1626]